jgi:3-oxoacyl-[acyl-carrier-protein] synthase II
MLSYQDMRRVVITGIGALTPLGNSFPESWEALKRGLSGIGGITRFDAGQSPWRLAGELKNFDPSLFLTKKEMNRLDPFVHYAVSAAIMAADDAGIFEKGLCCDSGVIIGSSRGGITMIEKDLKRKRTSPFLMPATTISMAASYVAQKLGIKGYCLGISNACASGANAIGEAYRLVRSGILKSVLAGGAEAPVCRVCIEGYGVSGALSKRVSQTPSPFDKKRDGFVLAEGSCIVLIEDLEMAIKRGARIYGEIVGYGNSVDAFHMTRPSAEGESMAIKNALKEAGIRREDIDLIVTHGTGTEIGDLVEMMALRAIFGDRLLQAVAIKSMTGHMLAASGAFEAAVTVMCLYEKVLLPTINISVLEDGCNLRMFKESKNSEINIAISNAFGFGGVNSVLVMKGY